MTSPLIVSISQGNKKLGKIPNFSLSAGTSCPGASDWCSKYCYAKGWPVGFFNKIRYSDNLSRSKMPDFERKMVHKLRIYATVSKIKYPPFRIHVSGDFYSQGYINKWIRIIRVLPQIKFYSYTRSWMIPELLPILEKLRALPNMQLFASCDSTMPDPPQGWRVAWIEGDGKGGVYDDPRSIGLVCPEQSDKKQNCADCKYCFMGKYKDVIFKIH